MVATVEAGWALDGPSRPLALRREWDLNPRWAVPTTVFETVRFGRSRIPPAATLPI
jgi:hypothetical protein